MDLLKLSFLNSYRGWSMRDEGPIGFTPYNSLGQPDWDSFIIFVINQGIEMIDYYTMNNIVWYLPEEIKKKYSAWIKQVEKTLSIKPTYPEFNSDECIKSDQDYTTRLNAALQYYSKCLKAVIICDELVFEAVGKIILQQMDPAIFGKWQGIRLIDIFFLGPFMMYLAREIKDKVSPWKAKTLYFFGVTTILVNLYFYVKILLWNK